MKTILVVDDEFDLLHSISAILEIEGYSVLTAPNGKAALDLLQERAPDLVITDAMMPYVSGEELLSRMHQIPACRTVPALLMSGAPASARAKEAQAFLQKPFTLEKLMQMVEKTIGKAD